MFLGRKPAPKLLHTTYLATWGTIRILILSIITRRSKLASWWILLIYMISRFQCIYFCFQVSDSALPYVLDILSNCIENTTAQKPDRIRLSLQSCEGFIGIFLSEESSIWLQEILDQFVRRTDADLGRWFSISLCIKKRISKNPLNDGKFLSALFLN